MEEQFINNRSDILVTFLNKMQTFEVRRQEISACSNFFMPLTGTWFVTSASGFLVVIAHIALRLM